MAAKHQAYQWRKISAASWRNEKAKHGVMAAALWLLAHQHGA